ncbi:restriction endonuclease subunit S [Marinilactibacillus psychrotolerans]|uniref:restriction endonuclease subunit S n=1 Tax=Marinilactibacillus psychrotolerans TaxID=191770 RepID=UPI003886AC1A
MSISKENKYPEIRFKGFTEAWEQRKLDKLAEFAKGSGYSKSDLKSEGTPVIHYGRLYTNYETSIKEVDTFVEAKDNSIISEGNEVIVPASGETSEDISRASVVVKPGVVLGGDLNIIKPGTLINPIFLALTISNGDQQKELTRRAQGKSVVHIRNSDLKEVNLSYPKIVEQNKIGIFFEKLEDTIALHQLRESKLKKLKKAYIQKLFPITENESPVIRFKEFNYNWDLCKLQEISNITMGQSPKGETYTNNPEEHILIQGNADMKNRKVVPRVWTSQVTKSANPGDIILSVRAPVGEVGITDYEVVLGRGVASLTGNEFLFQSLLRMKETGYWTKYSTGSTFESINSADLKNAEIYQPHMDEQIQIGELLETFDNLIGLQADKVNKLKDLKKGYLQKSFL